MDVGSTGPKVPGRSMTDHLPVAKSWPVLQTVSSKGTLQYLKPTDLNDEEEQALADVLNDVAAEIKVHRVHIQPNFEDFDPVRRGYITKATFGRALALAGIRFKAEREFELICIKFQEPSQRTYQEVNYRSFLKALEEISEGCTPRHIPSASEFRKTLQDTHFAKSARNINGQNGSQTPFQASLRQSGWKNLSDSWGMLPPDQQHRSGEVRKQELKEILCEIRRQIEKSNLDFPDFFSDADIRKQGVMPSNKFFTALQQFGIQLSAAQLDALEIKYCLPGNQKDLINWRLFVAAVNATPLLKKTAEKEPDTLAQVMGKVKTQLVKRRVSLDQILADHDLHNMRQVPKDKFFSVIRNFDIFLRPGEENVIYNAFKVIKGFTETEFMNYRDILEYLESDTL